jgi:hypothetical protein
MRRTAGERRRGESEANQVVTTTLFEILRAISEVTDQDDEAVAVFAELLRCAHPRSAGLSGLLGAEPAFAA